MPEIICKCGCGRKKVVRQADINRGWGKYYSKSCKAIDQEKRTHLTRDYYKNKIINKLSQEHGGDPFFDNKGEFEGIEGGNFDNTVHQDN